MKVIVEFLDGKKLVTDWPGDVMEYDEVRTGRLDKMENINVRYSHQNKRGIPVFREVYE